MPVNFLDIAPAEAVETTVLLKGQDGQTHEVRVFPFDAGNLAELARTHCRKAEVLFYDGAYAPNHMMDLAETRPYIVALGLVGPGLMRNKEAFAAAVAKVRAMPGPEQMRLYREIWARSFGEPAKDEGEDSGAPPTKPAEDQADAALPLPSAS